MMRFSVTPFIAIALAGCAPAVIQPPNIDAVPMQENASQSGVTCVLEGEYPLVTGTTPYQAVDEINALIREKITDTYSEGVQDCPSMYLELIEPDSILKETTQFGFHVELNEKNLLSITHFASHYLEGAAHPTNLLDAFTVDVATGKQYSLASLFRIGSPYRERLIGIAQEQMRRDGIVASDEGQTDFSEWIFYFRPNHLVLGNFFTIHALQAMQVAIPLSELADIAREDGPIARLLGTTPSI